jgi:alginate O-acetyltransferase complex protein AlgI
VSVCSFKFLLALILASAVFHWLPAVRLRQAFLGILNAGLLYSLVPDTRSWVALGLFVASGFVAARVLRMRPYRWILALYLTLLLSAFLVLKRYSFLALLLPSSVLAHTITIVGLSYMLFRQIHVAVDSMQGQIEGLTLWTFLNYQTNLFGLSAGPIQRFQEFQEDWDRLAPLSNEAHRILLGYCRIFLGILKIVVIAGACLSYYDLMSGILAGASTRSRLEHVAMTAMIFYLYPAYIYFNFSGYCDIVIGGAALFGIRMPENFDFPFLSRNMIEYWTRWHRTLGFWIRDYVFTPMYKMVAELWPSRAASLAFLCYFIALFLTGIWHGSTSNFVIFGLLNGLGVAAAKLWENWLIKRGGRRGFKAYLQSKPVRLLAVAGTFHYVCLTIFFFQVDLERSLRIVGNLATRVLSS